VPVVARALLAGLLVLVGVLAACWQPHGRGLDQWAFAILAFQLVPRRLVWHRPEPRVQDWRAFTAPAWADLALDVGWAEPERQRPARNRR
jgi:hypothetical protein